MPMSAPVLTSSLREGDLMTPQEFLRRWEAMPDWKQAELIVEISHTTSIRDSGVKLRLYERSGIEV